MAMSEHEKAWITGQGAEMLAVLGVQAGSSVVDFGCGKGRYAIPLSQVVGEKGSVLAVERDPKEVAVLRDRIAAFGEHGPIRVVNSEDLGLQSVDRDTIDCVLVFDVLQYVENWDDLFTSVRRVLKPGGCIHVYPATIPHPDAVNIERVALRMDRIGLQSSGKEKFRMMHNKHMVDDDVYTFILPN